jgi:hypothetical protein
MKVKIILLVTLLTTSTFAQEIPARAGTVAAERSGAVTVSAKPAVDSVEIAKKLV